MKNPVLLTLGSVLAVLVVLEWVFAKAHFFVGFSGLLGLGACIAVVLASKAIGRAFLQRPEADDER